MPVSALPWTEYYTSTYLHVSCCTQ